MGGGEDRQSRVIIMQEFDLPKKYFQDAKISRFTIQRVLKVTQAGFALKL